LRCDVEEVSVVDVTLREVLEVAEGYLGVLVVVAGVAAAAALGMVLGSKVTARRGLRQVVVPVAPVGSGRGVRVRRSARVAPVGVRPVLVSIDPEMCESVEFPAGSTSVTVGRGHQMGLAAAAGVSLSHCRLEYVAGEWRITDLGSRNGTWVDGHRVRSAWLGEGAEVRLGRTGPGFVFTTIGSTVQVPARSVPARSAAVLGRDPGVRLRVPLPEDGPGPCYPVG